MKVYCADNYKRDGEIIIPYNSDRPGKVYVQWLHPKERKGWIRAIKLREKESTNRVVIKYF